VVKLRNAEKLNVEKFEVDVEIFDNWNGTKFSVNNYGENTILEILHAASNAVSMNVPYCYLSVLFTDDDTMKEYNKQYRNKDKATNVLSFPAHQSILEAIFEYNKSYNNAEIFQNELQDSEDTSVVSNQAMQENESEIDDHNSMPPFVLGDIVLGYETILKESLEQNVDLHQYTEHLIIHGLLHLLGYHHYDEEEETTMNGLSDKIKFMRINLYKTVE
jgi:probable rRNA maturation factor